MLLDLAGEQLPDPARLALTDQHQAARTERAVHDVRLRLAAITGVDTHCFGNICSATSAEPAWPA